MAARRKKAGRTTTSGGAGRTDAISLLQADHRKVEDLFSQLEKTTPRGAGRRKALVSKIASELKVHMRIEEEIFYPAFREAVTKKDDKEMYFEAREEHHAANMVLTELIALDPSDETFGAKAKVLKEQIEHHVEEEEEELFPKSRRAIGMAGLRELATVMEARKSTLTGQSSVGRLASKLSR